MAIVAVEPGIKPAVAASRNGRIGVMATPATLRSDKFQRLAHAHGSDVQIHLQPCPGLAGQIERLEAQSPELHDLIEKFTTPLREARVDTVVLGCTHYPFVARQIQAALGADITLIDTADAVARQVLRLAPPQSQPRQAGRVRLQTTGTVESLEQFAHRWLPMACEVTVATGL
jgi:glutamate racemase